MIKFHCPSCNQKLGVPDDYAGRRIRCNKCNEPTMVPQPVPAESNSGGIELMKPQIYPHQADENSPLSLAPESVPVDPNAEILRQVSRQRSSESSVRKPASDGSDEVSSGRFFASIHGFRSRFGSFPLALLSAILCSAAAIALWMLLCKITGLEYGLEWMFIPVALAGPIGFCIFSEQRGTGMGVLALFIALFAIIMARLSYAAFFVIPEWRYEVVEAKDIPAKLAPIYEVMEQMNRTLRRHESRSKTVEPSAAIDAAICSLIMDDTIKPVTGQILRNAMVIDDSEPLDPNSLELKRSDPDPELEQSLQLISQRLREWGPKQWAGAANKYSTRCMFFETQCRYKTLLDHYPMALGTAFIQCDGCIFLFLRVVYCIIGIIGAYKTCSESFMD